MITPRISLQSVCVSTPPHANQEPFSSAQSVFLFFLTFFTYTSKTKKQHEPTLGGFCFHCWLGAQKG